MKGLTFNGIHSERDMGLRMKSESRHVLPEPKTFYEDIPGVDGEYDFSEVNPDQRIKYKDFTDTVKFFLIAPNSTKVQEKVEDIAEWLSCGRQKLIFDDKPDRYYMARVINKLDIESQLIKLKSVSVQFKCSPYGYGHDELVETVSNIIIPVDYIIENPGTYVKPSIKITGSFSTLTLTLGSKVLTYSEAISGAEILVDFDEMQCIKDSSINVSNKLSGDFFEFTKGRNTLQIGGTGLNCTAEVKYRPRYR